MRFYEPDVVYECTQSTVDRRYLFKPNHRPDDTLLHLRCDEDALDPRNDKLPVPSTINVIGSAYARAQRQVEGVRLHAAECNITHNHPLFSFLRPKNAITGSKTTSSGSPSTSRPCPTRPTGGEGVLGRLFGGATFWETT